MELTLPVAALLIVAGSVALAQWLVGSGASNRALKVTITAVVFSLAGLGLLFIGGIAFLLWTLSSLKGLPKC